MLSAIYLGHQSWLITDERNAVLVDPVLTRAFGNSEALRLEIWPPREVNTARMPHPDAIALTNEHLDHFHLESLSLLSRSIPVLVPSTFPQASVAAMRRLGFTVHAMAADAHRTFGDVAVSFLPGDTGTVPVWEARCASVLIQTCNSGESILVQSDTLTRTSSLTVDIFVATHNGQVRPDGWVGGLDNLLEKNTTRELDILREMAASAASSVQGARWVTFSGGSYRHVPRRHGQFELADFPLLAEQLNSFSLDSRFRGLRPGDFLRTDGSVGAVDWVATCEPLSGEELVQTRKPGDLRVTPIFRDGAADAGDEELARSELGKLARLIAATDFGQRLVDANRWGGRPAGSGRLVFQFKRQGSADLTARYSINSAEFVWETGSRLVDNIRSTPFGLVCWLSDFARVVDGTIQIWELASAAALQWYPGERRYSPLGFLYEAFAEPVRPDLASAVYQHTLDSLGATTRG